MNRTITVVLTEGEFHLDVPVTVDFYEVVELLLKKEMSVEDARQVVEYVKLDNETGEDAAKRLLYVLQTKDERLQPVGDDRLFNALSRSCGRVVAVAEVII